MATISYFIWDASKIRFSGENHDINELNRRILYFFTILELWKILDIVARGELYRSIPIEIIEDNEQSFFKIIFFYKEFIRVLFNYHSTSINRYHLYNKISVKILFIISCIFVYLDRLRVTFSYSYTHTRTFNHEYNSCMCAFTWACRNRMIYRLTCPNELSVHFYHRFSSIAGPPPNRLYPVPQWHGREEMTDFHWYRNFSWHT